MGIFDLVSIGTRLALESFSRPRTAVLHTALILTSRENSHEEEEDEGEINRFGLFASVSAVNQTMASD